MEQLTKLDKAILERLALKYPLIKEHIPYILVRERELTGVGMYVNFIYIGLKDTPNKFDDNVVYLSVDEDIHVKSLKHGLLVVASVSNGLLDHLEIVTYDELWDGTVGDFSFTKTNV